MLGEKGGLTFEKGRFPIRENLHTLDVLFLSSWKTMKNVSISVTLLVLVENIDVPHLKILLFLNPSQFFLA